MSSIRKFIEHIDSFQNKECSLCRELPVLALQELDLIERGLIAARNVLPNDRGGVQYQLREIVDPLLDMIRKDEEVG